MQIAAPYSCTLMQIAALLKKSFLVRQAPYDPSCNATKENHKKGKNKKRKIKPKRQLVLISSSCLCRLVQNVYLLVDAKDKHQS